MRFPSPTGFLANRRGNVAMMYALILPVLMFGAGFAIDYTHAKQVQTKLDAAADAAVLAALTPSMMEQSNAVAQTAAENLFNALASAQTSVIASDTVLTVNVCSPTACSAGTRTITVSYTAANQNIFSGVLGASALQIAGSSTANASIAPNINFYLLLDNSPSMALPATQAGITQMETLTPAQTEMVDQDSSPTAGCAFACHQYQGISNNPDTAGNPCLNGTTYTTPTLSAKGYTGATYQNVYCSTSNPNQGAQIDNYALARHEGIPLRLDEISTGVGDLMTAASQAQQLAPSTPPPAYEFAAYTMDTSWQIGMVNTSTVSTSSAPTNELMAMTASYTSGWSTASANFGVMEFYGNNKACGSAACTSALSGSGDWATDLDGALTKMNSLMPKPGNGTNVAGDTPQEVLFIITDGVADELETSCTSTYATQTSGSGSSVRCYEPINTALCTTIKNNGVRIAILYTDYLPVTLNTWYTDYVQPFNENPPTNSEISTELQACASPNLFYDAGLDSTNLGADLQQLFNTVLASAAHLTN